jgi:DNA-binding transcriptional LysR family regulator
VNFRCINRCFPGGELYRWEFLNAEGDKTEVAVKGDLVIDSDAAMIQAAESGLGIAFVYENLVKDHLKEGSLIRLLSDYYYLPIVLNLHPSRKHIPPVPLRTFITWVMSMNKNILQQ